MEYDKIYYSDYVQVDAIHHKKGERLYFVHMTMGAIRKRGFTVST